MSDVNVIAWDGPTRAFKWALVLVVIDGWISNRYGASLPAWHKCNGYAALILIVFRLFWGAVGGSTARFASFFAGPGKVLAYLRTAPRFLGHNPLGGWMVLALIALVGAMSVTGLFAADEDRLIIEGPFAKTISEAGVDLAARWHHMIFDAIEVCVVIHIAANIFAAFRYGRPQLSAIVTGVKPAGGYADMSAATPGSWARAAACLCIAAVLVVGAVYASGGQLL